MRSVLPTLKLASVVFGVALGVASSPGQAATRIVGTDLLGLEFTKALYAVATERGIDLALAFDGSRPGVQALKSGRAEAALLMLPAAEAAELRALHVETVAYQRVLVLVSKDCPLPHITLTQLAEIFGHRAASAGHKTWGGIAQNAGSSWSSDAVVPVAPEVGQGIVLDFFRHVVLGGAEIGRGVSRYRGRAELLTYFRGESRAIALAAAIPDGADSVKALPVAGPREGPVPAEADALASGRYALALPLLFVARHDAIATVRPLLLWLRSEHGAAALAAAELLPALGNGVREQDRK